MSSESADAKANKRRAQNRVAQQNYRRNIKKRIEDLESVNNLLFQDSLALNVDRSRRSSAGGDASLATSSIPSSSPSLSGSPSQTFAHEMFSRRTFECGPSHTEYSIGSPTRSPPNGEDPNYAPRMPLHLHEGHPTRTIPIPASVIPSTSYFPLFEQYQQYQTRFQQQGHAHLQIQAMEPPKTPLPSGYQTPLHQAVLGGHYDMARLLIRNGAQVNALDHQGRAPLHLAAYVGHTKCVQLLIEAGALVDFQDAAGMTALQIAAARNQIPCAEALLQCGAQVNIGSVWVSKTAGLSGQ